MKFPVPYNKTTIEPELPDDLNIVTLQPGSMTSLEKPEAELLNALENPPEGEGISALINSVSGEILIIVPDHTRVCGKEVAIDWLIDLLESKGVTPDRITVLVALGSHKPAQEDVLKSTIGRAYDRVKVIQHDPSGELTDYGTTSKGTRVKVNARLASAGLVILYTAVVHHYFAGFGGGRKIILPGVSSLETISANHSLVFYGSDLSGDRNPMVKSGSLDGNPVHDDMLEAANLVLRNKKYIALASVLNQSKEFAYITAGNIEKAHKRACSYVESHNCVEIKDLADVIIASAGGFPKDTNLIQSHKGMDNAVRALKPGGTLLYAMTCGNGTGNPAVERFSGWDLPKIREELARDYVVYGQTVYAMKEKVEKYRIFVLTELDPDLVGAIGFNLVSDLDEGLLMIGDALRNASLIYHMPRADMTVPNLLL